MMIPLLDSTFDSMHQLPQNFCKSTRKDFKMTEVVFKIPYKKVSDIPNNQLLKLHRDYWNFISDNKLHYKPDICNINGQLISDSNDSKSDSVILSKCFLCTYANRLRIQTSTQYISRCAYCPCRMFRESDHGCAMTPGPFQQWCENPNPKFARGIARLSFK